MYAIRSQTHTTDVNLTAILEFLEHPSTTALTLCASPLQASPEGIGKRHVTNLPLLSACGEMHLPAIGALYVVFDGSFLTCARKDRYDEVKMLLDVAEKSGKVSYATGRAPFTDHLPPDQAANQMLSIDHKVLTAQTRPQFFRMLSNLTERQFSEFPSLFQGG